MVVKYQKTNERRKIKKSKMKEKKNSTNERSYTRSVPTNMGKKFVRLCAKFSISS